VLVLGIDDAHRVVGVDELDDVLAHVVRGAGELLAQGFVHPGLEGGPPGALAANLDVGGEEVHVGVEVAHVQRQGILARQLADRLDGLQAVEAGGEVSLMAGPLTGSSCRHSRPGSGR
jgi:hypothetical protein